MSEEKPVYYGGSSAMAYGGGKPIYYGSSSSTYGQGPAYYGGRSYGGAAYGAQYGYGAGTPGATGAEEGGSFVGTITVGRMLRVVSQRWLTVFVFLLVGLVVSFAVYRISPTVYEATSSFTMDMRHSTGGGRGGAIAEMTPDYGSSYAEIFNTRLSDWRSQKVAAKAIQQYRADDPTSTVSDEELGAALGGSRLEIQRNSRNILIHVRSGSKKVAAAVANAYAAAIEAFTEEENVVRCDKAVSQIHANVEQKQREVSRIAKELLDFRTANKVDNMRSTRETMQQAFSKATSDILQLEAEETQLVEWEKMLSVVQKNPQSYGSLSTGVPRAEEIASEYRAYQDAQGAYQGLLVNYTESHPEVIAKKKLLEISRQRFLDAAARALLTGRSMLQVTRNQLVNLRAKQESLRAELSTLSRNIVLAESGLSQREAEFAIANDVLKGLILDENQARLEAGGNNEIVRVGSRATPPGGPILPNPTMIFGTGIALSVALGLLFVLVLDNIEDTVVNLADIEGRLSLKVMAVLPHVRRKKREQVAKFIMEDKYSQFSEAVAGLRNMLDSPRYEPLSHCMLVISTQPGEGKTITSTSLAIAYAQTGRRTLLVDFDLRRPRGARVWGLTLDQDHSFSHVLQKAGDTGVMPDFPSLVNRTDIEKLSVISSLPPEGVSPATILGSKAVAEFFAWARTMYDRIIIDSPPFGLVGDVVSLATLVDSSLVMCCPDRTHFKPIQYCVRCLTESGANILGVIVNDVEVSSAAAFSPSARHRGGRGGYYGYYGYGAGYGRGYGYGYGYKPKSEKERAKALGDAAKAASPEKPLEEKENSDAK